MRIRSLSLVRFGLVAVALSSANPAGAQEPGSIAGRVSDQTGSPLPGVTVELAVADAGVRTAITDERGGYRFDDVPAGEARLAFRLINFAAARRELLIAPGEAQALDITLALSLSADVTVTGPRTFRQLADLPNPAENVVGIAAAASEGAVTAEQLETRPLMRAGEVLETVPGVVISQHSGEGKANQYYLRGFNLDHGTDFATTVAGVPVNLPTHGHGHGYSDLNFLIPELVSGVQFRKGPYYAEEGDFSAAGAADISYLNRLERPLVRIGGGEDGWGRLLAAASPSLAGGHLLAALELNRHDGPWVRPDGYRRLNGVLRYSRGDARNGWSISGLAYDAEWDATDQIPVRAIERGVASRFGFIDPTSGGRTHRHSVAADWQRSGAASVTRTTGFLMRYGLNLFSNFTYFLEDPVHGDQFEQEDRRWVSGGSVTHRRLGRVAGRPFESAIGVQVRRDDIGSVGLFRTAARRRLSTVRADEVHQSSLGIFGQAEVQWTRSFRTLLGVRGDVYRFEVDSSTPANSGLEWDGLVSPKASAAFGPWTGTEVYVSGGFGFHSNDARGATIRVDPVTGEPAAGVTPLARARGAEIGIRTVRIPRLQSAVALWVLGLQSELVFVGDAGTTEASRPSRRYGLEWTNYARLAPWLTFDADLAVSAARFTDADPAGDRIPGAADAVVSMGVSVEEWRRLFGSLRLRYFGPRPLVEDDSVRSDATTLVNVEAGYRFSDRVRLALDVFNLLDAQASDIDYFYTSRLPFEPSGGVDDVHLHPVLPRTARLMLEVGF